MTRFSSLGPRIFSPAGEPHDMSVSAFLNPELDEAAFWISVRDGNPVPVVRGFEVDVAAVGREDAFFDSSGRRGECASFGADISNCTRMVEKIINN